MDWSRLYCKHIWTARRIAQKYPMTQLKILLGHPPLLNTLKTPSETPLETPLRTPSERKEPDDDQQWKVKGPVRRHVVSFRGTVDIC